MRPDDVFSRRELAAAGLAAGFALLAGQFAARSLLGPWGLLAGAAVGLRAPDAPEATVEGGVAGLLAGTLLAAGSALAAQLRLAPLYGPAFAADEATILGFAVLLGYVPLYGIEATVAAPATLWLRRRVESVGPDGGDN